jgi:hypothetical protein
MTSTTTPEATPQPGGGQPEVDLTAYRLAHRAMVADATALADLADRLAGGRTALTPGGAEALASYCRRLCADISDLHAAEGREFWPVVAAAAGAAVDLSDLADDHEAIEPVLARFRSTAAQLALAPTEPAAAAALAGAATDLRDLLAEHVAEDERDLFPAVLRFVPAAEFAAAAARARRRLGVRRVAWLLPWLAEHASGAETERLLAVGGPGAGLLLVLGRPRFRRARRAALG